MIKIKHITKFFLLLIIFFGCIPQYYDLNFGFKNEFLLTHPEAFNNLLQKYNLKNNFDLQVFNVNYLYPFSKLIYEKIGNNKWTEYLLIKAIKTENIFQNEAFEFYTDLLIEKNDFAGLKTFILSHQQFLNTLNEQFLINYVQSDSIKKIQKIPEKTNYFSLVYHLAQNHKIELMDPENQEKIDQYIIKSQIYQNNTPADFLPKLNNLFRWCQTDYFLACLYYAKTKQRESFIISMRSFLASPAIITRDKLELLQRFSINLGVRKQFYQILSTNYKNNLASTYYYGLEVLFYENTTTSIRLLQNLPHYKELNLINHNIRYRTLYYSAALNRDWVVKVLEFYNDYPNYYKSKILINLLIRNALMQNKTDFLIPLLEEFVSRPLNASFDKSIYFYLLYLIDTKNQTKWKDIIVKNYPLSYPGLRLSQGDICFIEENQNQPENIFEKKELSKEAQRIAKKINLLLEFNFLDEAKEITLDQLNNEEKAKIFYDFYNYYINIEDYYHALKTGLEISYLLYGENNYKITNKKILQMSYPLHFKEIILKYSAKYQIDPALAYAVMREESYFKKDIVSYQNAVGLMQIMPSTGNFIAQKLKIKHFDLRNPEDNINMGIYYLNFLCRYDSNYEYILTSYNAGQGRTRQWKNTYRNYPDQIIYELIPIEETRNYVKKVIRSYYIYKYLLENDNIMLSMKK